jgi:hypothetical protein
VTENAVEKKVASESKAVELVEAEIRWWLPGAGSRGGIGRCWSGGAQSFLAIKDQIL